jgi:hypothetical protein
MAPIKPRLPRRSPPQLTSVRAWCQKTWQNAKTLVQRNPRFAWLLIFTVLLIAFLVFATLWPSTQPCEGSLTLQSLSFESTQTQPLLVNTPTLRQLTLKGKIPLRLTGQFSNNPDLTNQTTLQLTPLDETATLQLTNTPQASLELRDLSLSPQTQVEDLRYDTYNKRLHFNLRRIKTSHLILNPNGSFAVQLTGYRIDTQPNLPPDPSFTWQPDNQLILELPGTTDLSLRFTEFTEQIFWGNLAVKNVKLDSVNVRAQNYQTNYSASTILGGTVRLADKTTTLETNQFLRFQPADSIDTLMNLSLSEEKSEIKPDNSQTLKLDKSTPGLKLDFSGKTNHITIGLNPKNPVLKLQASFLEAWMPRDAVIALIAFLSTLTMTLIGWLWEIATDDNSP